MSLRSLALLVLTLACASTVQGFYPGRLIRRPQSALLRMSANEFGREPPKPSAVDKTQVAASASEDSSSEEPPVRKQEISDEMRRRLLREMQSQGGDANVSAGNPILVISGIIALLVIVGGKGFFY